jgi:hypothetical protein
MSENINLISKNVWPELSKAVRENKKRAIVAVAYFGRGGAARLPLSKGSILVVDASISALKNGQTCPDELLKLYYKGVMIYSLEKLHAKLYVIGKDLYCGSPNVSGHSEDRLKEVLIKTSDKKAVADAVKYIKGFCRVDLGEQELISLKKDYKPPKFFGGKKVKKEEPSRFYICKLRILDNSEEELNQFEKGRVSAESNRTKRSRHRVDEFSWGKRINFKIGDNILQIIKDKEKTIVAPIGRLIHVRKWSNGSKLKHFCYLEVPDRRYKNLEAVKKQLNHSEARLIQRGGKKTLAFEDSIKRLWK